MMHEPRLPTMKEDNAHARVCFVYERMNKEKIHEDNKPKKKISPRKQSTMGLGALMVGVCLL
jgi:hypothetical protein